MILLLILLLTLALLVGLVIMTVSTVGAIGIVVFGDVIVCIVFIVLITKWLIKRKRK